MPTTITLTIESDRDALLMLSHICSIVIEFDIEITTDETDDETCEDIDALAVAAAEKAKALVEQYTAPAAPPAPPTKPVARDRHIVDTTPCPKCGVHPGRFCKRSNGKDYDVHFIHVDRRVAYGKRAK